MRQFLDNLIIYFSGTGNCLAIARKISGLIGGGIFRITAESVHTPPKFNIGKCVIVLPSYAYGAPKLVRKFLKTAEIKAEYLAILVSYGSKPGAAGAQVKKLLAKKRQKTDLYLGIQSVENYIPIFGLDPKKKEKNLIAQDEQTLSAAAKIIGGERNKMRTFYPLGSPISLIFRAALPLLNRLFKITDACKNCGLCVRACPSGALTSGQDKPKYNRKKCEHCQACLNICPAKAVRFWRYNESSPRYRHLDVEMTDLFCREEMENGE